MTSATAELAGFAAGLKFEDIPADVVHQAERLILDTCACAVAGYALDNAKTILHAMEALGGRPEATLFPTGQKTSVPAASFVNVSLSNALDMDDNLLYHCHFANTSVLPAVAMAEREGVRGRDLVAAVVASYEVTSRITLSQPGVAKIVSPPPNVRIGRQPVATHNYNVFGAAVGPGRILRLDPASMAHAMGIAGANAPVPGGSYEDALGSTAKGTNYGWQGWTGATAAILASQGITGRASILDGPNGFWKTSGAESCDASMLTRDLGTKWWIMDTTIKAYPAGTWMRPAMLATDKIVEAHDIRPEEIEKVVIRNGRDVPHFIKNPWAEGRQVNAIVGQTNFLYLVIMRAMRIPPTRWHTRESYSDPQALRLLRNTEFVRDPKLELALYEELVEQQQKRGVLRATRSPTIVEIHARGRVFNEFADYAKGDPFTEETRMTDEDIAEKFRAHSAGIIRREHAERAIEALLNVSRAPDVRAVTPLLTV